MSSSTGLRGPGAALQDLEVDGYSVLRAVVPDEALRGLESNIRALLLHAHSLHQLQVPSPADVADLWLSLKRQRPWLKGRCYDLFGQLGAAFRVLDAAGVLAHAEVLLGGPAVCDHVQVRMDDASNERALPLHQELAQMSLTNLTAWIPMHDLRGRETGSLCVVPGSHREGLAPHREFEEPFRCWGVADQERFAARTVELRLSRGDVLLFHPLLVHGSVAREAEGVRATLVGRLNSIRDLSYLSAEAAPRHYPEDRRSAAYGRYEPARRASAR